LEKTPAIKYAITQAIRDDWIAHGLASPINPNAPYPFEDVPTLKEQGH